MNCKKSVKKIDLNNSYNFSCKRYSKLSKKSLDSQVGNIKKNNQKSTGFKRSLKNVGGDIVSFSNLEKAAQESIKGSLSDEFKSSLITFHCMIVMGHTLEKDGVFCKCKLKKINSANNIKNSPQSVVSSQNYIEIYKQSSDGRYPIVPSFVVEIMKPADPTNIECSNVNYFGYFFVKFECLKVTCKVTHESGENRGGCAAYKASGKETSIWIGLDHRTGPEKIHKLNKRLSLSENDNLENYYLKNITFSDNASASSERFKIDLNNCIGQGGFGRVYCVKRDMRAPVLESDKKYVVKIISLFAQIDYSLESFEECDEDECKKYIKKDFDASSDKYKYFDKLKKSSKISLIEDYIQNYDIDKIWNIDIIENIFRSKREAEYILLRNELKVLNIIKRIDTPILSAYVKKKINYSIHKNNKLTKNCKLRNLKVYLLMERYYRNLYLYFKTKDLKLHDIKKIIRQIIYGILTLHENNVLHHDLKMDNIMIRDEKKTDIAIIDFGLSVLTNSNGVIKTDNPISMGTITYYSPEMLYCVKNKIKKYTTNIDWWSIAIIIFQLVTKDEEHIIEHLNSVKLEKTGDKYISSLKKFFKINNENLTKKIDKLMEKFVINNLFKVAFEAKDIIGLKKLLILLMQQYNYEDLDHWIKSETLNTIDKQLKDGDFKIPFINKTYNDLKKEFSENRDDSDESAPTPAPLPTPAPPKVQIIYNNKPGNTIQNYKPLSRDGKYIIFCSESSKNFNVPNSKIAFYEKIIDFLKITPPADFERHFKINLNLEDTLFADKKIIIYDPSMLIKLIRDKNILVTNRESFYNLLRQSNDITVITNTLFFSELTDISFLINLDKSFSSLVHLPFSEEKFISKYCKLTKINFLWFNYIAPILKAPIVKFGCSLVGSEGIKKSIIDIHNILNTTVDKQKEYFKKPDLKDKNFLYKLVYYIFGGLKGTVEASVMVLKMLYSLVLIIFFWLTLNSDISQVVTLNEGEILRIMIQYNLDISSSETSITKTGQPSNEVKKPSFFSKTIKKIKDSTTKSFKKRFGDEDSKAEIRGYNVQYVPYTSEQTMFFLDLTADIIYEEKELFLLQDDGSRKEYTYKIGEKVVYPAPAQAQAPAPAPAPTLAPAPAPAPAPAQAPAPASAELRIDFRGNNIFKYGNSSSESEKTKDEKNNDISFRANTILSDEYYKLGCAIGNINDTILECFNKNKGGDNKNNQSINFRTLWKSLEKSFPEKKKGGEGEEIKNKCQRIYDNIDNIKKITDLSLHVIYSRYMAGGIIQFYQWLIVNNKYEEFEIKIVNKRDEVESRGSSSSSSSSVSPSILYLIGPKCNIDGLTLNEEPSSKTIYLHIMEAPEDVSTFNKLQSFCSPKSGSASIEPQNIYIYISTTSEFLNHLNTKIKRNKKNDTNGKSSILTSISKFNQNVSPDYAVYRKWKKAYRAQKKIDEEIKKYMELPCPTVNNPLQTDLSSDSAGISTTFPKSKEKVKCITFKKKKPSSEFFTRNSSDTPEQGVKKIQDHEESNGLFLNSYEDYKMRLLMDEPSFSDE